MSDISQSAAIRSNLLLLQQTQKMIDRTQLRLNTGKKINSALDGPQSFFASKGLNQRASDLMGLKDAMGQAISTIKAADTAISQIQTLIDQAKGLTDSALQNMGNDAQSVATRRQLATDFNTIVQSINDLARDSGYGGRNLAIGDGTVIAADGAGRGNVNQIEGLDATTVTNVARADTYSVSVSGSGAITGNVTQMAQAETARGLQNLRVYGTQDENGGTYNGLTISMTGGAGQDKTITVSDGTNTRSIQVAVDGSSNGTYVFNFSNSDEFDGVPLSNGGKTVVDGGGATATGVIVEFTVDVAAIESVPQTSGVGTSAIEKFVDHQVTVTNSSGESITRDASRSVGTGRLSSGENAFVFEAATVRTNVDSARLQVSAAATQAVVGSFTGADAGAVGDYITNVNASNFTETTQLNFSVETTRAAASQAVGAMEDVTGTSVAGELTASYSALPTNGADRIYRYEASVTDAAAGDIELATGSTGVAGATRGYDAGSVTVTGLERDADFRISSAITAANELTFTLTDQTTGSTLNFTAQTATFGAAAGVQTITFEDADAGVTVTFDVDLSSAATEALQAVVPGTVGNETMALGDNTIADLGFTANNIDAFAVAGGPTEPVEYTVSVASVGTAARMDFSVAGANVAITDAQWMEIALTDGDGNDFTLEFSASGGNADFTAKAAYVQTALRNAIAGQGIQIDGEAVDLTQITVTSDAAGTNFTIDFGNSGLRLDESGGAGTSIEVFDAQGGASQIGGGADAFLAIAVDYTLDDGGATSTTEEVRVFLASDGTASANGIQFTGATLDFAGAVEVGTTLEYSTDITAGATATFTYVPEGYTGDGAFSFTARETTLTATEIDALGNTVSGPVTLETADGDTALFGQNVTVSGTVNGIEVSVNIADVDNFVDGDQATQTVTPAQSAMVNLTVTEVDGDGNTVRSGTVESLTSSFSQADLTLVGSGQDDIDMSLSFNAANLGALSAASEAETSSATIYNVISADQLNGVTNSGTLSFSLNGGSVSVDLTSGAADLSDLTDTVRAALDAEGIDSEGVTATFANNTITLSDSQGRQIADVSLESNGAQYGVDPIVSNGREAGLNASVAITQGDTVSRDVSTRTIVGGTSNNDLFVTFNERRTSVIQVQAINLQTDGTGLRIDRAANNWQDVADIERAVSALDNATNALRAASSSFSTALNIVTTRETFTEEFSNVLREGADKLVLADQNEEGANMLTLQTRQQLGTIALSIANQSQQSILRLF